MLTDLSDGHMPGSVNLCHPCSQVVGVHYESVERSDFRLCTRCYQHEISSEQLTPGAHPMQRIAKDAHAQVRS